MRGDSKLRLLAPDRIWGGKTFRERRSVQGRQGSTRQRKAEERKSLSEPLLGEKKGAGGLGNELGEAERREGGLGPRDRGFPLQP